MDGGLNLVRSEFIEHLAENFDILTIDLLKHVVNAHGDDVTLDLVVLVQFDD